MKRSLEVSFYILLLLFSGFLEWAIILSIYGLTDMVEYYIK